MAFGQYLGIVVGIVGAIVGGIIGFYSGGPPGAATGAAWGFSIGSMVGGISGQIFWPEKADINAPPPPQPHETRVQCSSWGMPIPIQYGSGRMAGNIIYMSDITETIERSKHRQDGVRYYEMTKTYTATFAIAFCEGPVAGVARLWMNGKVFADWRDPASPDYPQIYNGLTSSANIDTTIARSTVYFTLHLGEESQASDATLAALLTAAETPAYRGVFYIVFVDFPVGEKSGVPDIEVEVLDEALVWGWEEVRPAGDFNKAFNCLDMGKNGQGIIVCETDGTIPGRMYLSLDTGASWSETRPLGDASYRWTSVATDADGKNLIASKFNTRLYISNDYGASWAENRPAGDANYQWNHVSSNSSGSVLMASIAINKVYITTTAGASWSDSGLSSYNWGGLDCNYDGSKMIVLASSYGGSLYTSANYGASWTEHHPHGTAWDKKIGNACAVSGDGTCFIAGLGYPGQRLYVSIDSGATWRETQPNGNNDGHWYAVALNESGRIMYAADYLSSGSVYKSSDFGLSWTRQNTSVSNSNAFTISCDRTGSFVIYSAFNYRTWLGRFA
jgi:hypothetical protein